MMKILKEDFRTAAVKCGETVEIRLPENASTGFAWTFNIVSGTAKIVEDTYIPAGDWTEIGGGGTRIVSVRPGGDADIIIEAALKRPWLEDPEKKLEFTLLRRN